MFIAAVGIPDPAIQVQTIKKVSKRKLRSNNLNNTGIGVATITNWEQSRPKVCCKVFVPSIRTFRNEQGL